MSPNPALLTWPRPVVSGPTYTPLFTDDFNRADGDLGSGWYNRINTNQIQSNCFVTGKPASWTLSYAATAAPGADVYAQMNVVTITKWNTQLVARLTTTLTGYKLSASYGGSGNVSVSLVRYNAGDTAIAGPYSFAPAPFTLRLECIGSSINGYVNGTLRLSAIDATYTAGRYAGIMTIGDNVNLKPIMDNFEFGSIA